VITPLLTGGEGAVFLGFALDLHAPALAIQAGLALLIYIALVGPDIPASIVWIKYGFEVQGIVLAGRRNHHPPDKLVTLVYTCGELVAKIRPAMLFGPFGFDIFLPPFSGWPTGRCGLFLNQLFFV
jgi:hypothetical protein